MQAKLKLLLVRMCFICKYKYLSLPPIKEFRANYSETLQRGYFKLNLFKWFGLKYGNGPYREQLEKKQRHEFTTFSHFQRSQILSLVMQLMYTRFC